MLYSVLLSRSIDFETEAYNCKICIKRKYYKDRNCNGDLFNLKPDIKNKDVRFVINRDVYINYCPKLLLFDEEVGDIIRLFVFFEKGHLLEEGGVANQPYWYYISMLRLTEIKNKYEAEIYGSNNNK